MTLEHTFNGEENAWMHEVRRSMLAHARFEHVEDYLLPERRHDRTRPPFNEVEEADLTETGNP